MAAYHSQAQPGPSLAECLATKVLVLPSPSLSQIDNPCVTADCQGMCLLAKDAGGFGVGFKCTCPIGQKLVDGKRCVDSMDFLLFSSNKVVRGIFPDQVRSFETKYTISEVALRALRKGPIERFRCKHLWRRRCCRSRRYRSAESACTSRWSATSTAAPSSTQTSWTTPSSGEFSHLTQRLYFIMPRVQPL